MIDNLLRLYIYESFTFIITIILGIIASILDLELLLGVISILMMLVFIVWAFTAKIILKFIVEGVITEDKRRNIIDDKRNNKKN